MMWDLTIRGDHDFYVDTPAAAVLVHNTGPASSQVRNLTGMTQTQADKILSEHGFELIYVQKWRIRQVAGSRWKRGLDQTF